MCLETARAHMQQPGKDRYAYSTNVPITLAMGLLYLQYGAKHRQGKGRQTTGNMTTGL
jgi:hypothetical protein